VYLGSCTPLRAFSVFRDPVCRYLIKLNQQQIDPSQNLHLRIYGKTKKFHEHTPKPIAGFEPRIPLLEKLKTAHALDRMALVTLVG
jgi:hypothetical protein